MEDDRGTQDEEAPAASRWPSAPSGCSRSPLDLFWILDAALQFQPFMFGRGFVDDNILANANGQPFVLGDLITHIGNFVAPDVAVWNTFFALIQLFIGVGLLFPRWVRPALAMSFVWVLGVWVHRRGPGHAPHRVGQRADRRARVGARLRPHRPHGLAAPAAALGRLDRSPGRCGLVRRRPGHRPHHHAAGRVGRVLVAGGRPLPAARQPDRTSIQSAIVRHGRRPARLVRQLPDASSATCSRPRGP